MKLHQAIHMIDAAGTPGDLFPGSREEQDRIYKDLAKACHPDKVRDKSMRKAAEDAFKKLSNFYANRDGGKPATSTAKIGNWAIVRPLGKGDIADVYLAETSGDGATALRIKTASAAFKIARDPDDNDLMGFELVALKDLWKGKSQFTKYLPKAVDSFTASGRATNVITLADECFSLSEIHTIFPDGLDFRHGVWMMNRLLSVLGFIHNSGYIHGAITPDHLMYRPKDHGLILIDWTCSIKSGSGRHIPLLVDRWKALYPPEVARKKAATPGADIYMAAECINHAVNGNRPKRFKPLFDHCWAGSPSSRPHDAWELQQRWVDVAEKEYGPAKFLALDLPVH